MLCTPPAFILSQDQTLECLYLILPKKGQILIRAWLLFTFCLSSISLRIFEFRSHTIHESLHVQCLYFPLVVQFSMTDFLLRSLRRSTIISQWNPFVNTFFEIFFNFFQKTFKPPAKPWFYWVFRLLFFENFGIWVVTLWKIFKIPTILSPPSSPLLRHK